MNPPETPLKALGAVKNGFVDSLMLRYLLHIIGDIHQPLHAITLYSKTLYDGKLEGGDLFGLNIPVNDVFNTGVKDLHNLWDSVHGEYAGLLKFPLERNDINLIERAARKIIKKHPESQFGNEAKNLDIKAWIGESYTLAVQYAYSDIDLFTAIRNNIQIKDVKYVMKESP